MSNDLNDRILDYLCDKLYEELGREPTAIELKEEWEYYINQPKDWENIDD